MNLFRNSRELWIVMICCSVAMAFLGWGRGGSAESFLLNVSTELIGILVTVVVVDQVLQQRERQRLEPFRNEMVDDTVMMMNTVVDEASGLVGESKIVLGLLLRDGLPNRRIDEAYAKIKSLREQLPLRPEIHQVEDFSTLRSIQFAIDALIVQLVKIDSFTVLEPEDRLPNHRLQQNAQSIVSDIQRLLESPSSYPDSREMQQILLDTIQPRFLHNFVEFLERMQDMYGRFESTSNESNTKVRGQQTKCCISVVVSLFVMMLCFVAVVTPGEFFRPRNVSSKFDVNTDNWAEQDISLLEHLLQSVKARQQSNDSNKLE